MIDLPSWVGLFAQWAQVNWVYLLATWGLIDLIRRGWLGLTELYYGSLYDEYWAHEVKPRRRNRR